MNLLQIQDALKGLPDEELRQEMMQPTGMVPQYLIMTEMQRRKTMREEYNAQPQPRTTVADDMRQEMGLGGLQQSQVQPQSFAEGGMVGYANGGRLPLSRSPYGPYISPEMIRFMMERGEADVGGYMPDAYMPERFVPNGYLTDELADTEEPVRPGSSGTWPMLTGTGGYGRSFATEDAEPVARQVASDPREAEYQEYMKNRGRIIDPGALVRDHYLDPRDAASDYDAQPQTGLPIRYDREPRSLEIPERIPPVRDGGGGGAGSKSGSGPALLGTGYGAVPDFEPFDVEAARARAEEAAGGIYSDVSGGLKALQDQAAQRAEEDKWLALAQMGMGIASGTSPYFATNVGAGGVAGLEALAKARSAAEKRDMALLAAQSDVAKNREQARAGRFGEDLGVYTTEGDLEYKFASLAIDREKVKALLQKNLNNPELASKQVNALTNVLKSKIDELEKADFLYSGELDDKQLSAKKAQLKSEIENITHAIEITMPQLGVGGEGMGDLRFLLRQAIENHPDAKKK